MMYFVSLYHLKASVMPRHRTTALNHQLPHTGNFITLNLNNKHTAKSDNVFSILLHKPHINSHDFTLLHVFQYMDIMQQELRGKPIRPRIDDVILKESKLFSTNQLQKLVKSSKHKECFEICHFWVKCPPFDLASSWRHGMGTHWPFVW